MRAMNPHLWWYLARATGYAAWATVTMSVLTGLVLSTRLARGRVRPAWTLDLHRFLAAVGLTCTGLHLVGLVADSYVHFGATDVLVPFASDWRPGAVALGILSLHLLVVIEVSSLLLRRLPRRAWHGIHLTSFVAFWATTFHLLAAGTDAANVWSRSAVVAAMGLVAFLTVHRALTEIGTFGSFAARRAPARSSRGPAIRRPRAGAGTP
jgi:hypothetical protein